MWLGSADSALAWQRGPSWPVPMRGALALAAAGIFAAAFVGQWGRPSTPPSGSAVADWLTSQNLRYGLGGYWVANSITVDSGGAVRGTAQRPFPNHRLSLGIA